MTDKIDIVDAVSCICPQIDFLAYVLSMITEDGIDRQEAGGLSSILSCISDQLKAAIREVSDDPDK